MKKSEEKTNKKIYSDQILNHSQELLNARNILIYGSDAFQRDNCFKHIFRILSNAQNRKISVDDGMNTFLFYGDEYSKSDKVNSIIETINLYSFDSSEKVVSIRYFDMLNTNGINKIADYTDNPNPQTKLIIVAEKINQKLNSFKKIVKNSFTIETKEMKYTNHLLLWLNQFLKDNPHIKMDENAKRLFVSLVEPDSYTAYNELKKLELFVSPKQQISMNDIKECTIKSKQNTVFDLIDSVGYKQKAEALRISDNLIKNDESVIMIISLLSNLFFTLWNLSALRKKSISYNELKDRYMQDVIPFFRDKYIQFLKNYSQNQINNAFKVLYVCDSRAKLSMATDIVLLTDLVCKVIDFKEK